MVFNFPIMVIASAVFTTKALDSTILLNLSASRQLFAIFITAVQACERSCCISAYFFIISFIIVMYVFVFQSIIIEQRNYYVFTIFRDSQLVFVPLKKTIILRVLCPELFDPYCQLNNYSWAAILF